MNRFSKTLLLCCLALMTALDASAQDEKPCIELRPLVAECAGFNGDGKPVYAIKFYASITNPDADILYVSSNTGHIGTPTYNLPLANPGQVFRYTHTGASAKACFTFTVYNMTEDGRRRLCRVEQCVELPRCAPKCSDVRKLYEARPHLATNNEDIVLSGVLGFSPFGVGAVSMEVVRANHRRVCSNTDKSEWEPIRTEVSRAAITGLAGPRIDGNQALWNLDSCVRFTQKRTFELLINLPPVCPSISTSNRPIECIDTVTFCIRYTVKICPDVRCDTVICYRIIRKCRTGGPNAGANLGELDQGGYQESTLNEYTPISQAGIVTVPNPVLDHADITLVMPEDDASATADIIDVNGNVVATIITGLSAGETVIPVNMQMLASGMYLVRLRHATGMVSQPLHVIR